MTGLEIGVLAGLAAKLMAVGIDALKAREVAGWGTEEAKALQSALAAVPGVGELFKRDNGKVAPFTAYIEVVTIAFGEAWRRHWLYDERLAPKDSQRTWKAWLKNKTIKQRIEQIEERLREAKLDAAFVTGLPGEGDALQDLRLLESVKDPLSSPWYAALWKAFARDPGQPETPPLLVLASDGSSQREFERHFRLAFRECLATPFGKAVVEWQLGHGGERGALIRELLAARLSTLRSEHLFGTRGESSGVPYLALESQYVEPDAQQLVEDERPWHPEPVLALIERLLENPENRVVVVVADFGRGKSLTARTLAYRYAERFLELASTPTAARDYPIFIRCQESLVRHGLNAETTVRRGQKRFAESFLSKADVNDDAFALTSLQKTLVILDGLDEVQLSGRDTEALFGDLLDRSNQERRFVVLSRPAAVPREVRQHAKVVVVELQDFRLREERGRRSQVLQWLNAWSEVFRGPVPTCEQLAKHGLLELCAVPVLLFMIAQTWEMIRDRERVTQTDVYEAFILLTARSKLEHDGPSHPVVEKAATELRDILIRSSLLPTGATRERAIIELLSRIAWKGHTLQQLPEPKTLTSHDVGTIVRDLGLSGDSLELVERGVLLALSVSLGDGDHEVHFAHKSFREFLVAKYWEARLARIVEAPFMDQSEIETQLYGARLIAASDNSYRFLVDLCRAWEPQRREQLVTWACGAANNETLTGTTLLSDQRYIVREAALGIATALSQQPVRLKHPSTLASLIASFQARGLSINLHGTGIVAIEATLPSTLLPFANLEGADLAGANLEGAYLVGARLTRANLAGANLHHAHLEGAHFEGANLEGATLQAAQLGGAHLQGARLGADLESADFRGAHLAAAHLSSAHLVGANFARATYSPETELPPNFSPEEQGMILVKRSVVDKHQ